MGRRLLRVLAAAAAAVALLVPTALTSAPAQAAVTPPLPGVTAPPAASTAPAVATTTPDADGKVTLSVDALAPEVITGEESLTITGSITNRTDQPVRNAGLVVQVQPSTEVTVDELELWLAQEYHTRMSQVHVEVSQTIAPGESYPFTITVPAADLPLDDESQWGPRGLEVVLTRGEDAVASDRTIVLWDPGTQAARAPVTAVVPVAASGSEMTALLNATTFSNADEALVAEEVEALRDRVTGLLGLARKGVVLAVDPALLEALGLPLDEAGPAQADGAEPQQTSTAGSQDSDPGSQSSSATARAELAQALTDALAAGDVVVLAWQDADLTALAHLGENALAAQALTRAQESATMLDAALGTGLSSGTTTVLATGPLDQETLSVLPHTVTTVIASPGDLPVADDLFYTPSGTATVDGRAVLVPDEDLSDAASGTSDGLALSDLDARQLLRADSAVRVRQAPSVGRDVVVTVSRAEAAAQSPAVLGERLDALLDATWTVPQALGSLVGSAREDETNGDQVLRAPLPQVVEAAGEASAGDLLAARAAEADLETLTAILSDPAAVTGDATDVISASMSTAWRSDGAGRSAYTAQVSGLREVVASALSPAPSSTINVIAESASVPVRVVSSLSQDVTVRVHLEPSSTRLQVPEDVEVTVPAQGQATVGVPITAVGSGEVEVTIDLLAPDGTSVGTPVTILTRVHADWESMGTRVVAGLLVIVLVVGIIRTVRRGRRSGPPDGAPSPAAAPTPRRGPSTGSEGGA